MKNLVGYITAGVLEDSATSDLILSMKDAGADAIELGVPFSDPVADGPVIERASQLALANGFKFERIYDITKNVSNEIDMLWMGYFNSFYQKGMKTIAQKADELNLKGLIIPDLPFEESRLYHPIMDEHKIALIDFVAPTDTAERIKKVTHFSSYFIYLVAYAGITGSGQKEDLTKIIENIRAVSDTNLYVGFGVNEKTAKEKVQNVDGVIVGSAFIQTLIDEKLSTKQKMDTITQLTRTIKERINE
jgi:tryptophan synthase alpha chain